jgi:hypothetical protein
VTDVDDSAAAGALAKGSGYGFKVDHKAVELEVREKNFRSNTHLSKKCSHRGVIRWCCYHHSWEATRSIKDRGRKARLCSKKFLEEHGAKIEEHGRSEGGNDRGVDRSYSLPIIL